MNGAFAFPAILKTSVPNEPNERMHRVEATLDRLTAILDQLTIKLHRLNGTVEKVVAAATADGENIRALACIA